MFSKSLTITIAIVLLFSCKPSLKEPDTIRSRYITAGKKEVRRIIKSKNLFDYYNNRNGGFPISFNKQVLNGTPVVTDPRYKLMWSATGSEYMMDFKDALKWIKKLNRKSYGGYSDWRLPTFEEAGTLLNRNLNSNKLYSYVQFSPVQRFIWTGDVYSESMRWVISFSYGSITTDSVNGREYVRPVRKIK